MRCRPPTRSHRPHWHAMLVLGSAAWMLAACGSSDPAQRGEPVNVGLNAIEGEEAATAGGPGLPDDAVPEGQQSLADRVAQQAADLQALMSGAAMNTEGSSGRTEAMQPQPGTDSNTGLLTGNRIVSESVVEPTPPPPPQQDTGMGIALGGLLDEDGTPDDARVAALTTQIEQLVSARVGSSNSPLRDALALIAADMLRPGGPSTATPIDQQTLDALAPSERQTLDTLRQTLSEIADSSPESAAGALQEAAEKLQQSLGVRVSRAELCSRVDSFGSYVPFAGTDFMARRPNPALVYVEVERFTHRALTSADKPNTPGDRWAVDLSKELRLYHKADGRLAWRKPAERVVDTSRNRMRDFYLVTRIELPETLTVGSYELHVVIRDETSGTTDEVAVPIGIVADPALVNARP